MVTKLNTNVEDVERALLQRNDINIFDIFAILYLYCESRFHTIRTKPANQEKPLHLRAVRAGWPIFGNAEGT
jgi:hypothetical protein